MHVACGMVKWAGTFSVDSWHFQLMKFSPRSITTSALQCHKHFH